MTLLDDFWIPLGALIGAILLTLAGYFHPRRNGALKPIHNAAIIDSSIIQELVVEARRIATALEAIQRQIEKTAHEDNLNAILERKLRDEIDKLRREAGK